MCGRCPFIVYVLFYCRVPDVLQLCCSDVFALVLRCVCVVVYSYSFASVAWWGRYCGVVVLALRQCAIVIVADGVAVL